jgi:tetratricopeptide (TPR) repeat protein
MIKTLPNWKDRQRQLYSKDRRLAAAELSAIAEHCLEEGRLQDALEYFSAAKDAAGLAKVEALTMEEGDAFLLSSLERLTAAERTADAWNRLGDRAFELGKYEFARKAFTRTANELMLAKIRSVLGELPPELAAATTDHAS